MIFLIMVTYGMGALETVQPESATGIVEDELRPDL